MKPVSDGEQPLGEPVGVDPQGLEPRDPAVDAEYVSLGLLHGGPDQPGPLEAVAAGAVFLADQLQRGLQHPMVAVAGDAGGPPLAKYSAVGTGQIVPHDPGMTATAKSRNIVLFRLAQEAAGAVHGIGWVLGVAAVAGVAGDAVFGMDAAAPKADRCPEPVGKRPVALQANRFRLLGCGRGRLCGVRA